jgi:mevalonate kinase
MLAGEYGAVIGGGALTVPFHSFGARVRSASDIPPDKEKEAGQSLLYLQYLYKYIQGIPVADFHAAPDLDLFRKNFQGYWLDMNIPVGYGLGSSGAVSAAIYDLFFPGADSLSLKQQKEDLAVIESCFHGRSSGVDALTCHAGTTLRFHASGRIQKVKIDPAEVPGAYGFFLLDSGEKLDTGPLVKHFLEQMNDPDFKHRIEAEYLPLNELLIEALAGEREADPAMLVKMLSEFQLKYFRRMIPEKVRDLWIEGQVSNEYYLKLNGSGGGYMLGIAHQSSRGDLDARWGEKLLWVE